ncbi:GNAT family N-acetyltransferase [Isoptericola sp. NEAU-Y5]|uniref:GNAT family N-acetyltransferase n=1 Tax=Isoptericola luteus TaxID=2879484 RepID=A0ABS7ZEN9_9MICO|nr:GNAT family N-acetyltransferase [Isoptericola sp. NEAU-Y5]MCA5893515.1 GNAT family N-acetyltransferase [Isoptericola sp. NEAU-Y5]
MEPFVLATDRFRLSVPTPADVDRIAQVCADPEVARWVTVPVPYTRTDAEEFVNGFVPDGWSAGTAFTWAVRAPGAEDSAEDSADDSAEGGVEDGPVLGMVGMTRQGAPGTELSGELGFWCAPDARGRGVITDASRVVVDWALDPEGLGLSVVRWRANVGNWPSRRVAWKLGFRHEGTLRRFGAQRGVLQDSWVASAVPEDPREPNEPWPAEAPGRP